MPEQLVIEVVERAGGQGAQATQQRAPSVPAVQPRRPVAPRAADRVQQTREGIARVEAVAGVAGQAATGRVMGAFAQGVGRAATLLGPLGVAAVAVTAAFGVVALAVRSFARMVQNQVRELAAFSAPVAVAQEQSDLARELATIRRAQTIGPQLARAERLRSRFEIAAMDLGTQILNILLRIFEAVEPFIALAIAILERVTEFLQNGVDQIFFLVELFTPLAPVFSLLSEALRKWLDLDDDDRDVDPLVDQFIKQALTPVGGAPGTLFDIAPGG